jgi:purine-binding chemotaxis protein CheW
MPETAPQTAGKKSTGNDENIIQLIVFRVADELFGAEITQVREIIRKGDITPIPDSPDFISGVTNIRGEIAVVIDLKKRFYLPEQQDAEEKHIVMTKQDSNLFGIMVDEVVEVLRVPQGTIKKTPDLVASIDRVYISGVLTRNKQLVVMLDLGRVLSEEELTKLSKISVDLKHRKAHRKPKASSKEKKAAPEEKNAAEGKQGEKT